MEENVNKKIFTNSKNSHQQVKKKLSQFKYWVFSTKLRRSR